MYSLTFTIQEMKTMNNRFLLGLLCFLFSDWKSPAGQGYKLP